MGEGAGRWHWVSAGFLYLALTGFVFRGLIAHLAYAVPIAFDYHLFLWNTAWVHRAIVMEGRSPYFTDWIFYPHGTELLLHTLGVSALVPVLPVIALVGGVEGVVAAHNCAILASFVLCGLFAYLLAVEETGSRAGALVAGIVFSFSAHRMSQLGWTDMLSAQYLVAYLLFLLRALRSGRPSMVIAAGVCAALVAYDELIHVLFAVLLTVGVLLTERVPIRRLAVRAALVSVTAATFAAPLAWRVWHEYLLQNVVWSSPPPSAFDIGNADLSDWLMPHHVPSWLAGLLAPAFPEKFKTSQPIFHLLKLAGQQTVFEASSIGYVLLGLLVATLLCRGRPRPWRWLAFGCAMLVLSLGPHLKVQGVVFPRVRLPFTLLEPLPGFSMLQFTDRFALPALLSLSLFGAAGVEAWLDRVAPRPGRRGLRFVLASAIVGAGVAECCLAVPSLQRMVPSGVSRALAEDTGDYAVVDYPPETNILSVEQRMWDQVTHGKRLLFAYVSRIPVHTYAPRLLPVTAPAAAQAAWLEGISAERAYRLKVLVVHAGDSDANTPEARAFVQMLAARYPVVARDPGGVAFYVGGPAFDRDQRTLRHRAARVQTAASTATSARRLAALATSLEARANEFRAAATRAERANSAFGKTEGLVAAALCAARDRRPTSR